jgi:heme/copper-type cytochrome/quinol oxidase subunit 4
VLWVGRIAGGIVGFAVAIIFTEVVFRDARDAAPLGVTAILIVLGAFAGSRVALHFRKEPS